MKALRALRTRWLPKAALLAAAVLPDSAVPSGKIDTSGLTGFHHWLAELYNDHRCIYALTGVFVLLAVGTMLGMGSELVLSLFGRETQRIEKVE